MGNLVIYGAGGFAREVAWLAHESDWTVCAFVDDDAAKHGKLLNDVPVMSIARAREEFSTASMVVAVGGPLTREALTAKASRAGFDFATLIHPRVERSQWVTYGPGTVICAGTILTTNIVLGEQVQINLDCTVGHDVVLEDYATLAPGAHISGNVRIGRGAYVGTGATIINGTPDRPLVIGEGARVGAGACVVKSVEAGLTVVGVPAKVLARN